MLGFEVGGNIFRATKLNCESTQPNGGFACALAELVSTDEGARSIGAQILEAWEHDDLSLLPGEIQLGIGSKGYAEGTCTHPGRMAAHTLGILMDERSIDVGVVVDVMDWMVTRGLASDKSVNQNTSEQLVYVRPSRHN